MRQRSGVVIGMQSPSRNLIVPLSVPVSYGTLGTIGTSGFPGSPTSVREPHERTKRKIKQRMTATIAPDTRGAIGATSAELFCQLSTVNCQRFTRNVNAPRHISSSVDSPRVTSRGTLSPCSVSAWVRNEFENELS